MTVDTLRQEIGTFLGFSLAEPPVDFATHTAEAYTGEHELTQERFDAIVEWVVQRAAGVEAGTR